MKSAKAKRKNENPTIAESPISPYSGLAVVDESEFVTHVDDMGFNILEAGIKDLPERDYSSFKEMFFDAAMYLSGKYKADEYLFQYHLLRFMEFLDSIYKTKLTQENKSKFLNKNVFLEYWNWNIADQREKPRDEEDGKVTMAEFAATLYYKREKITKTNASKVASKYWSSNTSGQQLFDDYTEYSNVRYRQGNGDSIRKAKAKWRTLGKVLKRLPENSPGYDEALVDMTKLLNIINSMQ